MNRPIYGHGVTRREAELLERFERGESHDEIARAMKIRPDTVRHLINYYTTCLGIDPAPRRMMESGNRRFLQAILREAEAAR